MTIKQIIADIIAKEGGYNNHPLDKGGPTKYGITRISYAEYFKRHYENIGADDIKAISKDLAEKIYYTLYYVRPNINKLPELIQPIILDMANAATEKHDIIISSEQHDTLISDDLADFLQKQGHGLVIDEMDAE